MVRRVCRVAGVVGDGKIGLVITPMSDRARSVLLFFYVMIPQERRGRPLEQAFAGLGVELVVMQRLKYHAHVGQVLRLRRSEPEKMRITVVHTSACQWAWTNVPNFEHQTARPVRAWPATARLVKGHHRATKMACM